MLNTIFKIQKTGYLKSTLNSYLTYLFARLHFPCNWRLQFKQRNLQSAYMCCRSFFCLSLSFSISLILSSFPASRRKLSLKPILHQHSIKILYVDTIFIVNNNSQLRCSAFFSRVVVVLLLIRLGFYKSQHVLRCIQNHAVCFFFILAPQRIMLERQSIKINLKTELKNKKKKK